jgi:endopolyphosphatase
MILMLWTLCAAIPIGHRSFVHITDLHIDPYYQQGASKSSYCHRFEQGKPSAGPNGARLTKCDSPTALVQNTIDRIKQSHNVQFVVLTGDNARHDYDRMLPNSRNETVQQNALVANMIFEAFPKIPIISSIGNNDVYPKGHLDYESGNSQMLRELYNVWHNLIPGAESQTFRKIGCYALNISSTLKVLSLNTVFAFNANSLQPDCQPMGTESRSGADFVADWLEAELKAAADQQIHVIITGHIPPSNVNYKAKCYQRYAKAISLYQGVIKGQLFGHMNVDYFFAPTQDLKLEPLQSKHFWKFYKSVLDHLKGLANVSDLPPPPVLVSPSVIPNFNPSYRLFTLDFSDSLIGYTQYYLASKIGYDYKVLYSTKDYGMTNLTAASYKKLAQDLQLRSVERKYFDRLIVGIGIPRWVFRLLDRLLSKSPLGGLQD